MRVMMRLCRSIRERLPPAALPLMAFCLLLSGCSAFSQPPSATPTATATHSPTALPSPSDTPAPTFTATASPTPSASPLPSNTPTTTPSATPSATPSVTPMLVPGFVFDNWDMLELPDSIKDGIGSPLIAYISSNNRVSVANLATAQPFTGIQTLYFASPTRAHGRLPILEITSDERMQVFLAPGGGALAYIKRVGDPRSDGLYVLDLASGFSARTLPGSNPLVQRGLYTEPSWAPDGESLALAIATAYDIDIYLYPKEGSGRRNITEHGAYDLWPRWSPDGRAIAFVSDRALCPSWIPGEAGFCDILTEAPPIGGHVYLYDTGSGDTRRLSDAFVSEAPYWIDGSQLAFASGDPFDLLNPQRRIWITNVDTGAAREVSLPGSPSTASYLSEAWSPNGDAVLVQVADSDIRAVLLDAEGGLIGEDDALDFPRFSMSASWAADGALIAIGGASGQCPFGVRVKDSGFGNVARGSPPPTMCDPQYSPKGDFLAFSGVNPRVDGRNDIYVANKNGFGAVSLTADLRGQVELIGWVGG